MMAGLQVNKNHPWDYFLKISEISRKSGDEQEISNALVAFAQEHHLKWERDKYLNVCIRKSGSVGKEQYAPIVLQAHMDMVYEKSPESAHIYHKPLNVVVEGDLVSAKDTSLGADNGLGMAMILAVLASKNIPHPPIEALFTTGEEDGLQGAMGLVKNFIHGRTLLNLDGEVEDIMIAGCAGAFRSELSLPIEREHIVVQQYLKLTLKGLYGGHSGLDIHKFRGNAIVLLGRILWELNEKFDFRFSDIAGGSRMNVIPSTAQAVIAIQSHDAQAFSDFLQTHVKLLQAELGKESQDFSISICPYLESSPVFTKASQCRILNALLLLPNGVLEMSKDVAGLVQTSSNIGIIKCLHDKVHLISNPRSSVASQLQWLEARFRAIAAIFGGTAVTDSHYPSWEYAYHSPLRELYGNTYEAQTGISMTTQILHGGLECGVFQEKYLKLDAISVGPTIYNVHSTKECFSLSSLERVWQTLQLVLQKLPPTMGNCNKK